MFSQSLMHVVPEAFLFVRQGQEGINPHTFSTEHLDKVKDERNAAKVDRSLNKSE